MSDVIRSRVLVIDDSETIRLLLRSLLRLDGYDVVGEGLDGEHGLGLALDLIPDAIFLDVVMPKRNGLEILPELRAKLPDTKIIMLTSNSDRDTVQTAIKAGAAGFVVKPFSQASVQAALVSVFGDVVSSR